MKFFLKLSLSFLLSLSVAFFIILAIASAINGVNLGTQLAMWF